MASESAQKHATIKPDTVETADPAAGTQYQASLGSPWRPRDETDYIRQLLDFSNRRYTLNANELEDDAPDYYPSLESSWLYPISRAPHAKAMARRAGTKGARAARAIYAQIGGYGSPERTLPNDGTRAPLKPWQDEVINALSKPGLPAGTIAEFFEADHIPGSRRDDVALAVYERLKDRLSQLHWTDLSVLAKEMNDGYLSDDEDAAVSDIYGHLDPKLVAEGKRLLTDEAYLNKLRDAVIAPADAPLDQVVLVGKRKYWKLAEESTSSQWLLGLVYKFLSSWSAGETDEAVKEAIELGVSANAPKSKLLLFRDTAIGNVLPSRSVVAMAGNLLLPEGKLIISYAYRSKSADSQLRALTDFPEGSGKPLPENVRGRLFAVGVEKYRFDSIPRASDMLMWEVHNILERGKQYGISLPEAGNQRGEHLDVWTHSQAGPEILSAARLDIGGQGIEVAIRTLSAPLGGSRLADNSPAGLVARFLAWLYGGSEAAEAIPHLAPHKVRIPEHMILECRVKSSFATTGKGLTTWEMRLVRALGGGDDGMVNVRDAKQPCEPNKRTILIEGDHLTSIKHYGPLREAAAKDYLTGESPANKSPFIEMGRRVGPYLHAHGYSDDEPW